MDAASPPRSRGPLGWLRRFRRCQRAVAAVEMALAAPVLIGLLLGTLDVGWLLLAEYKLQRASATLADLIARDRQINERAIADSFKALAAITTPFDLGAQGRALVSSIRDDSGRTPRILWQRQSQGGITVTSRIGSPGQIANLDGLIDLERGESVIVAEIFYRFDPLVGFVVAKPRTLYYAWVATPRYGSLETVLP